MDTRSVRPVPESDVWVPSTDEERRGIREQLGRVLASSVFTRSKGCSSLLAYTVSQTLEGHVDHLKERTLGAEVFGRAPDYDTASDHVVRSTAADVRKRLAQYYMELARPGEIRIEIPLGSYVPRFFRPGFFPIEPRSEAAEAPIGPAVVPQRRAARRPWRARTAAIAVIVVGAVLSLVAIKGSVAAFPERQLNKFWAPVLQTRQPVLLCIGAWNQPAETGPQPPSLPAGNGAPEAESAGAFRGSEKVFLDDAVALLKLAGLLQQNRTPYRVLPPARVTFADLQTSPAILIGFNNYWITSFAGRIRFTVERTPGSDIVVLRDKNHPSRNDWSVNLSTPFNQPTTDYALVIRALDSKTGQIAVTAAGLTHFGTLAAGEFLTDPAQIEKLDAFGPSGWETKNVAIVLSTEVIKGSPGSAKIIAADFW